MDHTQLNEAGAGTSVDLASSTDVNALRRAGEDARAAERRLEAVIANSSDMVSVIDAQGNLTWVSPAATRLLGRLPADRVGRSIFDYVHPDDVGRAAEIFTKALVEPGRAPIFETRLRHEDGSYRWWEVSANNLLHDPDVRGIILSSRDITERRKTENSLHEAERRFEQVFENAAVGMNVVSLSGHFVRVNRSYCELVGYTAPQLLSMTIYDVCDPEDLDRTREQFERMVGGEMDGYQIDKKLCRADGSPVWVRISASMVRDDDGAPLYGIGLVADITDTRQLTERLAHEATHDHLTGVAARRVLRDRLERSLTQAHRTQASVAILLVDLDNFKQVNDAYGHATGDGVLVEAARRIQAQVRPADVVVRLGGDEFVVILAPPHDPQSASGVAREVAERIIDALALPFSVDDATAHVGASIGIALSAGKFSDVDALLAHADRAAYQAKDEGRGRYVLAAPA